MYFCFLVFLHFLIALGIQIFIHFFVLSSSKYSKRLEPILCIGKCDNDGIHSKDGKGAFKEKSRGKLQGRFKEP